MFFILLLSGLVNRNRYTMNAAAKKHIRTMPSAVRCLYVYYRRADGYIFFFCSILAVHVSDIAQLYASI